jgi:uncharacterized membrane protein YcjF (UPF0283 family)
VPEHSGGDPPQEERRRGVARVINAVAWLFGIAAAVGAVQVGRALWSRAVWLDYRGNVVTPGEMWRELIFFALVVIVCAPLAWYGRGAWRRRL